MLRFLQEYLSVRLVKAVKPKAVVQFLRQADGGNKLAFSAEDILRRAASFVATASPAREIILKGKIATLLHFQERLDEMAKLLTRSIRPVPLYPFMINDPGSISKRDANLLRFACEP